MNEFESALESDEFLESDESDESDEFGEFGESDEARKKRKRINPGKTARGTGLVRQRPAPRFVTQAELTGALERVGKQIAANSDAIKRVATQANKITSDIAASSNRANKQVGDLKGEVKKQADTSLMLTLLQGAPALQAKQGKDDAATKEILNRIEAKKPDMMLPLIMMSGSGGLGGGDSSNMLILALAMSGKL
jgi:hypothetical protein